MCSMLCMVLWLRPAWGTVRQYGGWGRHQHHFREHFPESPVRADSCPGRSISDGSTMLTSAAKPTNCQQEAAHPSSHQVAAYPMPSCCMLRGLASAGMTQCTTASLRGAMPPPQMALPGYESTGPWCRRCTRWACGLCWTLSITTPLQQVNLGVLIQNSGQHDLCLPSSGRLGRGAHLQPLLQHVHNINLFWGKVLWMTHQSDS